MAVKRVNGEDVKTTELKHKIMKGVKIPKELEKYMHFSTTSLGGLFLDFNSVAEGRLERLNSKCQISIHISIEDNFGAYEGDIAGLSTSICRGLKKPTSIKKKVSYEKVVDRLNKWIETNKATMIASLQK